MAPRGSLGKYKPGPPSSTMYWAVVIILILYSVIVGYMAAIQPVFQWRLFSWHPFLMTCGMVGLAGISAMTKKLGGYTNTKNHGLLGWASIMVSFAGLYFIYKNKEINGSGHLKTTHAKVGLGVVLSCVGLGMAGGIFLHPDFGVDKQNKTIRFAHKMASRLTLILAWITSLLGLFQLTQNITTLAVYGLPLVALVPLVLM